MNDRLLFLLFLIDLQIRTRSRTTRLTQGMWHSLGEAPRVEGVKGDEDDSDVVHGLLGDAHFEDSVYGAAALVVDVDSFVLKHTFPHTLKNFKTARLIKYAITCEDDVVHLSRYFELTNFWFSHDHVHIAAITWQLGLNVSKRAAHRQPTREYPMRTQDHLVSSAIQLRYHCLSLVNLATSVDNAVGLTLLVRFVVSA